MIGKQRPRITRCVTFVYNYAQSLQEVVAIMVVPKDVVLFDSSGNDMVQGPGDIDASLSRLE